MDDVPSHLENRTIPPAGLRAWKRAQMLFYGLALALLLLVVLGLLLPIHRLKKSNSPRLRAMTHARQLAFACKIYAADNNGEFPSGRTEQEVFQKLLDGGYLPDDSLFWMPNEARTHPLASQKPNLNKRLDPRENVWAYFSGLTEKSPAAWPLIADAWIPGTDFSYRQGRKRYGWKSQGNPKSILVRVDMSVDFQQQGSDGTLRGPRPPSAGEGNILKPDPANGWLAGATPILPVAAGK
jgi:hypothetical protein